MQDAHFTRAAAPVLKAADDYRRMPTPAKAIILANLCVKHLQPLYNEVTATGDVTQTNFFDATDGAA